MAVAMTMENPLIVDFIFYTVIVVLKMMFMSILTIRQRRGKEIFANPEDVKFFGVKKVVFGAEDVERVRRNHLNDLENIPAFVLIGFVYILTAPAHTVALWHFRIFAVSRFAHTLSYQLKIRQPARAASFGVGLLVMLSMAAQTLIAVM